jgi:uncharacterized protein
MTALHETPLHVAASSGNPVIVRQALMLKEDVNARTQPNGFTPLHLGISGTDSLERQEIVKLLHAAGANLELKTYDKGLTPLQLAAMRNKPLCVDALLQCGANVHATEGNGATALHGAAFFGYAEVSKLLLQAGADPALADNHGNTPISLARGKGHTQVHEILVGITNSPKPDKDLQTKAPAPAAGTKFFEDAQGRFYYHQGGRVYLNETK